MWSYIVCIKGIVKPKMALLSILSFQISMIFLCGTPKEIKKMVSLPNSASGGPGAGKKDKKAP